MKKIYRGGVDILFYDKVGNKVVVHPGDIMDDEIRPEINSYKGFFPLADDPKPKPLESDMGVINQLEHHRKEIVELKALVLRLEQQIASVNAELGKMKNTDSSEKVLRDLKKKSKGEEDVV